MGCACKHQHTFCRFEDIRRELEEMAGVFAEREISQPFLAHQCFIAGLSQFKPLFDPSVLCLPFSC
jgi:hypothetical protein